MNATLSPAPLGRRIVAGAIDAVLLSLLTGAYFLVPLLSTGIVVPMWGVLAAIVGYSVVPLATFRATLGMKLARVEIRARDGHPANAGDLLFRELVGRGFFPGAFLFTLLMSFVGSLVGVTSFAMPTGLGAIMALLSLGTVAIAGPGHLLALARSDRRSLADLLARTIVVPREPATPPADEDELAFWKSQRRRRVFGVIAFEALVVTLALALPRLLAAPTRSTEEYADRLTRMRLEKEFERASGNELIAQQLAEAYLKAGRPEDAEKVRARQLEVAMGELGCDKRRVLQLGDRLNRDGRYEAAIALVKRHEEKCGAWPRLLWVSLYAHQERGEWKKVTELATRLIDDAPHDSDFWWWRGEAFAELGQYEQAAADYHQSMANQPNGFAAGRYARWVDAELKRPCEGAFALGYWMDLRPDDFEDWAPEERARLYLAGRCDELLGRGKAVLKLSPGAPVSTAKLDVNGKAGVVSLTQPAGYTLLSSAFAAKAGVDASSANEIQVRTGGEWKKAKLVTLKEVRFGQATSREVLAAVVDALPDGIDAVLGVNLAWRFKVQNDGQAMTFKPLAPVGTRVVR